MLFAIAVVFGYIAYVAAGIAFDDAMCSPSDPKLLRASVVFLWPAWIVAIAVFVIVSTLIEAVRLN